MTENFVNVPLHHIKQEYCETRPKYRNGRKKTAVKVFTVNSESKYLIATGIPATGLEKDVVKLFSSQGVIQQCRELKDYPKDDFTQVYLVQYRDIQVAKTARIKLDEHYFFGSMLHIFYAPELETTAETREKIKLRLKSVTLRVKALKSEEKMIAKSQAKKQAKAMKKGSLPKNSQSSAALPATPGVGSSRSTYINQFPQAFVNNIPCNQAGIPLYLPPRPMPDMTPPCLPNIPLLSSDTHRSNPAVGSRATNVPDPPPPFSNSKATFRESKTSEIANTSRNKVVKTKPKLKARSGYFYENVLHKLISQPILFSQTTSVGSSSVTASKKINSMPVAKPPFLPRHLELKQLDEINKIDTLPDGEIPLLGSFVHEECNSKT